jgi:thioesterase domain-containing protein
MGEGINQNFPNANRTRVRRRDSVNTAELQRYLHEHIPLSKAMGVKVHEAGTERVTLFAPLAPNINHRETVFGGSASALALLAAWALIRNRLDAEGLDCRVVVQRNTIEYLRPIRADFAATAVTPAQWPRFIATLKRRHRARIGVTVDLRCGDEIVGSLAGDFVAEVIRKHP